MRVVVEADGGSRGNPGPAGFGAVVRDLETGSVLAERSEFLGVQTNNVAEYRGLIAGLSAAADLGALDVLVRMDSRLVVEQMRGTWRVKHAGLQPLYREATDLLESFERVEFEWIPRIDNAHADRLANVAMDAGAAPGPVAADLPWAPPSGMRTRLVLVRHAATAHSLDQRFSGRNDLPLDESGRAQAEALAARDFGAVGAVVSSPIRRSRETADMIAGRLGLDVRLQDDLAETDFGAFEGLTVAEAGERYPDLLRAWRASPDAAPPGGESFNTVARRVERARDALLAEFPDATVVVVTHVTPIKLLVRSALAAPMDSVYRMHLDTASVSRIDYAGGVASLRSFNETSHLSARNQPISR